MIMYLITSFNKLSSNLNYYVFNYYLMRKKLMNYVFQDLTNLAMKEYIMKIKHNIREFPITHISYACFLDNHIYIYIYMLVYLINMGVRINLCISQLISWVLKLTII
jgi:hypothetical protein